LVIEQFATTGLVDHQRVFLLLLLLSPAYPYNNL